MDLPRHAARTDSACPDTGDLDRMTSQQFSSYRHDHQPEPFIYASFIIQSLFYCGV